MQGGKLSSRLPPPGDHPPKADAPEFDLHVVNIVNGYRQPRLLRDETVSAFDEFCHEKTSEDLLATVLRKLDEIETRKRFRSETGMMPLVTTASRGPSGPTEPFVGNVKKEAFFDKLGDPQVPLEDVFNLPKLGTRLFLECLVRGNVPPPRAVWACRALKTTSDAVLSNFFGKAPDDKMSLLCYVQSFAAYAVHEKLLSPSDMLDVARKATKEFDRASLCQMVAPFFAAAYDAKPLQAIRFLADFPEAHQHLVGVWRPNPVYMENASSFPSDASRDNLKSSSLSWPSVYSVLDVLRLWVKQDPMHVRVACVRARELLCAVSDRNVVREGVFQCVVRDVSSVFSSSLLYELQRVNVVSIEDFHRWRMLSYAASLDDPAEYEVIAVSDQVAFSNSLEQYVSTGVGFNALLPMLACSIVSMPCSKRLDTLESVNRWADVCLVCMNGEECFAQLVSSVAGDAVKRVSLYFRVFCFADLQVRSRLFGLFPEFQVGTESSAPVSDMDLSHNGICSKVASVGVSILPLLRAEVVKSKRWDTIICSSEKASPCDETWNMSEEDRIRYRLWMGSFLQVPQSAAPGKSVSDQCTAFVSQLRSALAAAKGTVALQSHVSLWCKLHRCMKQLNDNELAMLSSRLGTIIVQLILHPSNVMSLGNLDECTLAAELIFMVWTTGFSFDFADSHLECLRRVEQLLPFHIAGHLRAKILALDDSHDVDASPDWTTKVVVKNPHQAVPRWTSYAKDALGGLIVLPRAMGETEDEVPEPEMKRIRSQTE